MKKNSTNQYVLGRRSLREGGFFNVRVLIGVFMVLVAIFLALLGSGALSASAASSAKGQQKYSPTINSIDLSVLSPGFDCSKVHELSIDKQENMRAGAVMIACGLAEGVQLPAAADSSATGPPSGSATCCRRPCSSAAPTSMSSSRMPPIPK